MKPSDSLPLGLFARTSCSEVHPVTVAKRPRTHRQQGRATSNPAGGTATAARVVSSHRYGTRSATASAARTTAQQKLKTCQTTITNKPTLDHADALHHDEHPSPSAMRQQQLTVAPADGETQRASMRAEPTRAFDFADGKKRRRPPTTPDLITANIEGATPTGTVVKDSAIALAVKQQLLPAAADPRGIMLPVVAISAAAAAAAAAVAPSTTVTTGVFPRSGGGSGVDRHRMRSRLSLGRHRHGDDGTTCTVSRGRGNQDSAAHGYPWGASFQQQRGVVTSR